MINTFQIDATAPMALLDVDNKIDNKYYRFCADTVMSEDGSFLADDELTYDDFELGPDYVLPAGTKVCMPHLWGWYDATEGATNIGVLTPATDYVITLPKAATVKHVVYVILSQYHVKLQSEKAGGRFFFIEEIREVNGTVEIVWGT